MKILLLGKIGQLGWELSRTLPTLGEVISRDYPEIDLSKAGPLRSLVRECAPDVIVNAAAYTAVDKAESERELAFAVNAEAPGLLAEEAKKLGAVLLHYSTDYVFNGSLGRPYKESDAPAPINVYGESKLAGEQAVQAAGGHCLIFRTAWVYSTRQGGFVTKVLEWARKNETLRIVNDQVSNPTWARTLAELTGQLLARGASYLMERAGLYHLAGGGFASRYQWARRIVDLDPNRHEQKLKELLPALTAEFPLPAQRPLFSALDCEGFISVFGLQIPSWEDVLAQAMEGR